MISDDVSEILLFGGNIKTILPLRSGYKRYDLSNVVLVPDNQEVFVIQKVDNKNSSEDEFVFFEIFEIFKGENYDKIIEFHIQELIGSKNVNNEFMEKIQIQISDKECVGGWLSYVVHEDTRHNGVYKEQYEVFSFLCLITLEDVKADILISMNVPVEKKDVERSIAFLKDYKNRKNDDKEIMKKFYMFQTMCVNFRIKNMNLFL